MHELNSLQHALPIINNIDYNLLNSAVLCSRLIATIQHVAVSQPVTETEVERHVIRFTT